MNVAASFEALARFIAGLMLNSLGEGVALALLAWLLLRFVGRSGAGIRFAIWFVALAAIVALPWLNFTHSSTSAPAVGSPVLIPAGWAVDLFLLWAAIAGLALLRVGAGLWQTRKLRRTCTQADTTQLDPLLQSTLRESCVGRGVQLCISDRLRVPTAIGFGRPIVALPTWTLHELAPAELNSILIHELAHLQRWDDWTNLAQKIIRALFFFHPAVCWIENKLSLEREMACDDVVLARTANPRSYAQCLVSIAERSFLRRSLAMAQAAVGRMRQTSVRVAQILSGDSNTKPQWKPAMYLATAFSILGVAMIARAPQLVAFENPTTPSVMAARALTVPASGLPAAVIPAAFHAPTNTKSGLTRARAKTAVSHRRPMNAMLQAKSVQPANGQGVVIEAAISRARIFADPQTVLVVMHTEQNGRSGPVWTVCVWRLTVFNPVPVYRPIPAKKI